MRLAQSDRSRINLVRDEKFLKWRFDQHPEYKYKYVLAKRASELWGYAIINIRQSLDNVIRGTIVDYLIKNNLMDIVSRSNKSQGGYCEYISKYSAPFILGNCNNTYHDILLLTHEVGHAFQAYLSREHKTVDYFFPTYEACEILSMSMEYFTFPWMHYFFGEDTDKYIFLKLTHSMMFLPICAQIDEFQHLVYEHPDASCEERNMFWKNLNKINYICIFHMVLKDKHKHSSFRRNCN